MQDSNPRRLSVATRRDWATGHIAAGPPLPCHPGSPSVTRLGWPNRALARWCSVTGWSPAGDNSVSPGRGTRAQLMCAPHGFVPVAAKASPPGGRARGASEVTGDPCPPESVPAGQRTALVASCHLCLAPSPRLIQGNRTDLSVTLALG
jgi:hypothetical protein